MRTYCPDDPQETENKPTEKLQHTPRLADKHYGGTTGGAAPASDRAAIDGGVACIPGTELDGGATGREGGATAGPNDTV